MPVTISENGQKTCFVVMGFGKKTDFETGRVLDLDKSYHNMIKPAIEAAGLKCIRADEIVHSGVIDVPMYELLLNADVVVADLSTSNKNAYYELGVRHALKPFTTVVIAEDGIKAFPFDVNHVVVRQYHHLGEDIGYGEAMRFSKMLTEAVSTILKKDPMDKDSPIYSLLNLTPPVLAAVQAAVKEASSQSTAKVNEILSANDSRNGDPAQIPNEVKTHSVFMQQVDAAQKKGDWITAKTILTLIRQMAQDEFKKKQDLAQKEAVIQLEEDPYLIQRLALCTYKSKFPSERDALMEARQILEILKPRTSNDSETLGLWGGIHKRFWELEKNPDYLDEAVSAYKRGCYIKKDYYNGINFAFLLNIRAESSADRSAAIADFVEAGRVRKEVLQICGDWMKENPMPDKDTTPENVVNSFLNNWYWVKATEGEAYVGLGDEETAQKVLQEAFEKAPYDWMKQSTEEQLSKLRPLLKNSPLRFIRES